MYKKLFAGILAIILFAGIVVSGGPAATALEPPITYGTGDGIDELLKWIVTANEENYPDYSYLENFLNAARKQKSIVTVSNASSECDLIHIQVDSRFYMQMWYTFCNTDRMKVVNFLIYLPTQQSLEEKISEINTSYEESNTYWRYVKGTADYHGEELAIYKLEGVESHPNSIQFEIMDFRIVMSLSRDLSNEPYEKYLNMFEFDVADLNNYAQWLSLLDVSENDWFYEDVKYIVTGGLMNGTDSGTFSPESPLTRGMVATILWRLEGRPSTSSTTPFSDVPEERYYTEAIAWAAENNIVTGYGDGKFGPDDTITREQFAAILYRYATLKGCDISVQDDLSNFNDTDKISDYALIPVKWAVAADIIRGSTSVTLNPSGETKRSEGAAMLHRFLAASKLV